MDGLDTGQKLYRLQNSQNDDGTVDLEIHEWSEEDNTIHIYFTDPLGDEHHVSCDMPRSTEEDNFFNDILDHTGWEYSTAEENLEGEMIPAEPVERGYDILPENVTWRDRVTDKVDDYRNDDTSDKDPSKLVMIILFPLMWIMGLFFYGEIDGEGKWYVTGGLGALLWVAFILFLLL